MGKNTIKSCHVVNPDVDDCNASLLQYALPKDGNARIPVPDIDDTVLALYPMHSRKKGPAELELMPVSRTRGVQSSTVESGAMLTELGVIQARLWAQDYFKEIVASRKYSKCQAFIKIEKLNSEIFETWKMQMKMILIHSDLWEYANSIRIKPETEVESNEWEKNDQKELATIVLSLSPPEIIHVKKCTTSAEAWKNLNKVHQPKGPATKVFLTKQLILLKMNPNERLCAGLP
ncbi:hypothetical protein LAZ67_9001012 [Cordylochernes scorpioides]|uniref:Uncharacterized protein n=1 Tax=Cordylochernes scorpioides TaxID=51811 RepID=A0ABY6KTG8_9ARAC|nr:hypothetical protein LAZ67_9001012 [Cordylochernes scorpioides]